MLFLGILSIRCKIRRDRIVGYPCPRALQNGRYLMNTAEGSKTVKHLWAF